FKLYKTLLRPLIRDADLYHISARPDGAHWDAIEYYDREAERGVVYAFRGSNPLESTHSFILRGLRRDAIYELDFHDHSSLNRSISGRELLTGGVKVNLPVPQGSELIFFAKKK